MNQVDSDAQQSQQDFYTSQPQQERLTKNQSMDFYGRNTGMRT